MKIRTETFNEMEARISQWHRVFAWFPISWDGGFAWLARVQRRATFVDWEGPLWEYK